MAALSNQHLATHRTSAGGSDYIKVYELETGKLLATHEATGGFGLVAFVQSGSVSRLVVVDQDLTVKVYPVGSKRVAHQVKVNCHFI